ncbi:hypothetical protein GCM10027277_19880 [Pseudoduganella ginsengisoli]|uniref:DUF4401 domain-containing protein n=1 Tax=Pseudoduganella ginsengisoli TaxID=1462440 RepID=A0A6L6PTK1_9BURK|nr:GDYXXLXY domain-containing protein [Pseudoduganella ginsengisoli]MTW00757.1 DUF4401 domain-containing protein [Pseudoduganella ginsengisoli]
MNRDQFDAILHQAAIERSEGGTPWLATAILAVGAWLAALPLIAFVVAGVLMAASGSEGGSWLLGLAGAGMLAGGMMLLSLARPHSFHEHASAPLMAAGIACIAGTLAMNHQEDLMFAVALVLSLAIIPFLSRLWLRTMFGAIAAGMLPGAVVVLHDWEGGLAVAGHLALLAWLAAFILVHSCIQAGDPGRAAGIEAAASGWLAVTLLMLAAGAGQAMFMHTFSPLSGTASHQQTTSLWSPPLALAAAIVLARAWSSLQQLWFGIVTVAVAAMAYFMPQLGAVLLALAICSATGRWRMAMASALAAAWVVGACYYQLNSSLLEKAMLFAGAGITVAIAAALARRTATAVQPSPSEWRSRMLLEPSPVQVASPQPARLWCIGLCAVAVLGLVNFTIWQKEQWIAQGQQVFVRLAPADPRSLMQGDYMVLRFDLRLPDGAVPRVMMDAAQIVMQKNSEAIAQPVRMHRAAQPLAANELLIDLVYKRGEFTLGTDAWYFTEGEAARYAGARYGEFRVHDGRAVLVGMRGENLKPL